VRFYSLYFQVVCHQKENAWLKEALEISSHLFVNPRQNKTNKTKTNMEEIFLAALQLFPLLLPSIPTPKVRQDKQSYNLTGGSDLYFFFFF